MSDLVEREAVLRTVVEQYSAHNELIPPWLDFTELPSVTQKSGKWVRYKDNCLYNQCSYCGASHCREDDFCPNCGAKMESEEKE